MTESRPLLRRDHPWIDSRAYLQRKEQIGKNHSIFSHMIIISLQSVMYQVRERESCHM